MSHPNLKTRFAPSPTGLLHLGNVRTALFNMLLARQHQGVLLLRMEDTDAARSQEKYAQALQTDLTWLGLIWQEGPGVGGSQGPYYQSQRDTVYRKYFAVLEEQGIAYRCFCTEKELAVSRKAQLAAGRPPRYSGRCRHLSQAEADKRLAAGMPATLRFHAADGQVVTFEDKVRGTQTFKTDDIGDFVIRRSDGTPAFFFSNAVDDALMGVTLVVRGEDHLTNTPRQLLILRALALNPPAYAHIALVVGADGAPLSKRTGSRSVEELRETGFLPLAINNYLARLGHTYEDNHLMTFEQLAANFAIERLHRAPARFDEAQLLHWQKEAVLQAADEALWQWMCAQENAEDLRIQDLVPTSLVTAFVQAVRENVVLPRDALIWAGNLFSEQGKFETQAQEVIQQAGAAFFEAALSCLENAADDFKGFAKKLEQHTGKKGKALFMPLRATLTGEIYTESWPRVWPQGPAMVPVWNLLGTARIRRRLQIAKALCTNP